MVQTINPAVSGDSGSSWTLAILGFSIGTLTGAIASFGTVLLLAIGSAHVGLESPMLVLFFGICVIALAHELGVPLPVPYRTCQVPVAWRQDMSTLRFSFSYGLTLGLGFLTLFVTSAHLASLTGVVAHPSWSLAATAAALFALGKTLPLFATAGARSHEDVLARLSPWDRNAYRRVLARRVAGLGATAMVLISLLKRA